MHNFYEKGTTYHSPNDLIWGTAFQIQDLLPRNQIEEKASETPSCNGNHEGMKGVI